MSTLANVLGERVAGLPLAVWLLAGGTGFYLLARASERGAGSGQQAAGIQGTEAGGTGIPPLVASAPRGSPAADMPTLLPYSFLPWLGLAPPPPIVRYAPANYSLSGSPY